MSKNLDILRRAQCECCQEIKAQSIIQKRLERRLDEKMRKEYGALRVKYGDEWWNNADYISDGPILDRCYKAKNAVHTYFHKLATKSEKKLDEFVKANTKLRRNLTVSWPHKDGGFDPYGRINRIVGDKAEVFFCDGHAYMCPVDELVPLPLYKGYPRHDVTYRHQDGTYRERPGKYHFMTSLRRLKIIVKEHQRRYGAHGHRDIDSDSIVEVATQQLILKRI